MDTQTPQQQTYDAPAAVQAPAHNGQVRAAGPDDDITEWTDRLKAVLAKPETITAPTPHNTGAWHNRFIEFFAPIDTCAITCCCPCVTFGKTHHRLRKDASMTEYNPINPTCVGFFVGHWFCLSIPLIMLQRHDIREKYQLQGDCAGDFLRACCCALCDLVQQDKEAGYRALGSGPAITSEQPSAHSDMKVPA